jgi:xanthosine utilization system XapX-like protein
VTRSRELVEHILRTFALVGGLAAGIILALVLLPLPVAGILILVAVVLVVYLSPRLQAHWTPVSDRVARFAWEDAAGVPHETVVEMARLESATSGGLSRVQSRILRVSSYRLQGKRRRLERVLVGDDAEWLGRHGERLWFLVRDRYHSGRQGLVGHDLQTLKVSFHQRGEEVESEAPPKRGKGRTAAGTGRTLQLDTREGRVEVELKSGVVVPVAGKWD